MGEYRVQRMKETSIGLIPEDWEAKSLSQIGIFSKGKGVSRANAQSGDIPCVRYGEIYTSHNDFIREFYSHISPKIAATATKLKKGDVLFAGSGETKEEIGKAVAFLGDEEAYAGGDIIILSPNDGASSKFLGYVLNGAIAVNQKASMGQGDAVVHIHAKELADVVIPFPPYDEQKKIADVLSAVDELIGALDEAIAKKRQIKEGLMQQLLTRKTAIPAIGGKWQSKRVGDIGFTYSGLTGKAKNDFGHGEAQYITFLNVLNNPILNTDIFERVDVRGDEHQNTATKGDLFFNTSSETPEEVGICSLLNDDVENLYLNSFCFGFRLIDPEVDGLYLSYFWRSKQGRSIMSALAQGATRYNLSKEYFNKTEILLPPLEQQKYIANLISAADNEIAKLVEKREKFSLIKQGMMQELLTGKTRLI